MRRGANTSAFINETEVLLKTQTRWNRLREVLNLPRCQSSLSHLYLSKNKFATAGIARLAAALHTSRSVIHIELAHCEISPASGVGPHAGGKPQHQDIGTGLEQVAGPLQKQNHKHLIMLTWSRLGYGVTKLADGLCNNTTVQTLDLCWNGCGYQETMAAISQALSTDTLALHTLGLALASPRAT